MYVCLDKEGLPIAGASYANLSEAKSYWTASVPGGSGEFRGEDDGNEITVHNEKGEQVGSIRKRQ